MKKLIEELQQDVEPETELVFTISRGALAMSGEPESKHAAESGASTQYVDSQLTDASVATMENYLDDNYLHTISEKAVIAQLDDLLLMLIAVREEACGKELLQDLRRLFGADLSPGTVYPHLTDLADEGLLEMTDLKARKVYQIDNRKAGVDRVETNVNRMIMLSLVLKALLIDGKSSDSQQQRGETNE